MPDELKRTVISPDDAAVREVKIELPAGVQQAISDSFERGKEAARKEASKEKSKVAASAATWG